MRCRFPVKTESVLRIKIPKADGNPDSRGYGYQVGGCLERLEVFCGVAVGNSGRMREILGSRN